MRSEQGESAFSDYMQGEFLPLGSHCHTGTLTRDKALKSRKNFFAKTHLIVLKYEKKPVLKKSWKSFWLRKFLASIGTLVTQWDTQASAACHAIRTGRVRLLWLHAKGSFCLRDLIAIPGLWLVTKHSKIGKFFFAKTYLIVLKHEKTCFEIKLKNVFSVSSIMINAYNKVCIL